MSESKKKFALWKSFNRNDIVALESDIIEK